MNLKYSFSLVVFSLFFFFPGNPPADKKGGLALYTVRNQMKEDPKGVLKKVAEIGYEYMEDAGYSEGKFYGIAPKEYKAYLKKIGLKPLSSHQSGITFENADKIIADVKAVGFKYLVIPIPPMGNFTYDQEKKRMGMKGGVDNLAKTLNILGKKCKEAGLKLLYHNHDFELRENEEGVIPLQYLLENTEPESVNFEMDLYWTIKGGADPLAYFEKYPGRFKIWHVKDMDDQGRFAPVGQGNIDFGKILAQKDKAGMKYYFVEQDQTYDGLEPMEAIKVSFEGLGKIGF